MCGIIGIQGDKHDPKLAQKALEKIVHRGTKHFEIKNLPGATIGANRLPIVGRNDGVQPISNEEGSIWAVLNGEIFNYLELKKQFEDKGYMFKTHSDTEILPYLYEEYGTKMIEHIDSEMFAFVIYDTKSNKIFAARDPIGVKPLYYAYDHNKNIYFFSELKEVSALDNVSEIHTFPPGSYYDNGNFVKYFSISTDLKMDVTEDEVQNQLASLLEKAVQKRVQTDLPVAVLLSGGVDSSLVMELANRHHPDVTAIILGTEQSDDYQAAIRLCKEKGYKYKVIAPDPDYLKELDKVIYYAETFEPNIIRHCFASHMCAKAIAELGIRIALVGEGSDEIFAGYNEFTEINPAKVGLASLKMTETLENSQLQRVDRMSMMHTIETRVPFLDTDLVKLAFSIAPELKVKRVGDKFITKYILRKTAERFLPDYIAWRYKAPFSNGAGMNVGVNYHLEDGEIPQHIKTLKFTEPSSQEKEKYNLKTIEDRYYFSKFKEYSYSKHVEAKDRAFMKDTLPRIFS